jgi:putative Holliday junction resolvase
MRVLALDMGEKRTGIAVSDPHGRVALPLAVLPTQEVLNKAPAFRRILEDHEVELLVVGLPLSLDGREHEQAARIRTQAARLTGLYGLPVEMADERLSSKEAKSVLRQLGYSEKDMRGKTDKIAASIVLQTWLDNTSIKE